MNRAAVTIGLILAFGAVVVFAGDARPVALVALVVGALGAVVSLLTYVDEPEGDIDAYWMQKLVEAAHLSHGGTGPGYHGAGAEPLYACTEPVCEEGRAALTRVHVRQYGAWGRGRA